MVVNDDRFCSIKVLNNQKDLVRFLLAAAIAALPLAGSIYTQPAIAQENSQPSISLEKNVIYVDSQTGDDSQAGKKESPFKTITQALKVAESGATIKLASGTYSEQTGETFPLIIKQDVTIEGSPKSRGHNITIEGNGYFVSPTGAGQNVAIAARREAGGIIGVTVTNNHERGHGLWIESSSPKVVSNTFVNNGNTGVSVNGNSSPLIDDNYFYNNAGNGLLVYGTSKAEVTNNTFEQTGFGVSVVQNATSTLTGNTFDGNRIGIILEGNSQGILRDNEIKNSSEYGLTAISQSRVNLGTTAQPGNNTFRGNGKLDIQNASSNEIVAVGTEISGGTEGSINFDSGDSVAVNDTAKELPPLLPSSRLSPLNEENGDRPVARLNPELTTPQSLPVSPPESAVESTSTSLPSPPPLPEENTEDQELVFNAPPSPEPVPSLPETPSSALNSNSPQIGSLSDVLGSSSANEVKYKVLVEALDSEEQEEVRSLYPDAFATIYGGKSVLQVGAFSDRTKAEQATESLEDLGLDTHILE